jgi:Mg2+/Co2+ transporter CorB
MTIGQYEFEIIEARSNAIKAVRVRRLGKDREAEAAAAAHHSG